MGGDSKLILNHTSYAIKFTDIRRLLDYYPVGHPYRIAFLILALTGMRLSELSRLSPDNFWHDSVVWLLGKNQRGTRQVSLPGWFMRELKYYLEHHPHPNNRIFNFKAESLRRQLHKIRPFLGGNFSDKIHSRRMWGKDEYKISLKSFRHTYQCFLFWKFWKEYGSAEMACALVSKEMKHSGTSYGITVKHYISSVHYLKNELELYGAWSFTKAMKPAGQMKLLSFC